MRDITLDHRYAAESGQVLVTGLQALARAPLDIARRDAALGLHTAGFISGYRGSPLGGYDQELSDASSFLKQHSIVFQPGVNEELAATAVWGTQQVNFLPGAKYDGVFGIWYGKAPGVDRAIDPMRHANFAGTWDKGGVLVLAGDDPESKSSTLPNQSEFGLIHAEMPVLNPSDVQEVLDFSVIGIAMSRYSGCWVSLIASTDNMDSHAVIEVGSDRYTHLPQPKPATETNLHIRAQDTPLAQEARMRNEKLPAVLDFARAAGVNRVVIRGNHPRIGIVATGRAYSELMQALQDLKLDADTAASLGISVLKIGMSWPLDTQAMREFATGLEEVLVVEDKRALLETQIKDALYDLPTGQRPRVIGKTDAAGKPLLSQTGVLTAVEIANVIAASLPKNVVPFAEAKQKLRVERTNTVLETRDPFYCSGCPHNRSTKVLPGSHALAGIGCHYMARWTSPATTFFSQMGGEGVQWLGQAPFTDTPHIFANLGDGTYFHSGLLAIRQAVAAKARMTYKILFNDAVAMTGGQKVDGALDVPAITRQLRAEGVESIAIVAEDISRYDDVTDLAHGVVVHPRTELQTVETAFRDTQGVTVIIYDQMCAAEKRRRRKRGLLADPDKRVFINELVCEGCGDCSAKSNCISVEPIETELGRKRRINQSSCNKDLSCVDGFCPSFVTVSGGESRRIDNGALVAEAEKLRKPAVASYTGAYNILVSGIGGLGVTTLAAILAMAAHLDERWVRTLNRTGLAQKGGAVASHVRIAAKKQSLAVPAVPVREMDLHLAYDMIVATSPNAISRSSNQRTYTLLNAHINPTSAFVRDTAKTYNTPALEAKLRATSQNLQLIDARELAETFLGNELYANMIMLGHALQNGLLPVTLDSLLRAIDMNGAAQKQNKMALAIGRLAAARGVWLTAQRDKLNTSLAPRTAQTFDDSLATRAIYLTAYQNSAYAQRYSDLVSRVQAHELDGRSDLTQAAARGAFAAMMIKDEYEVARLLTDAAFEQQMKTVFSGDFKVTYNLAPSWLARADKTTGEPRKIKFGAWLTPVLKTVAKLKVLRESVLDIFALDPVHRAARAFRDEYVKTMSSIVTNLTPANYAIAVEIAKLPLDARGYGHIKAKSVSAATVRLSELTQQFQSVQTHQAPEQIRRAG